MAKRFSRLKHALRTLRTPTSDGAVPDAPAGSILANFQEYDREEKILTYVRDTNSKPGQLLQVAIFPFALGAATGSGSITKLSKRAEDASGAAAVIAVCNHTVVDLEEHSYRNRYIPAKATIFNGTGDYSPEPSKITGVTYAKRTGSSYTVPYGASSSELAENSVRKKILTIVAADSKKSVGFKSERT